MSNPVFVTLPRSLGAERFDYVWAEHTLPRSVLEVPRDVAWKETVPMTVLIPGMILYWEKQSLFVYGGLSRQDGTAAVQSHGQFVGQFVDQFVLHPNTSSSMGWRTNLRCTQG
jgi:hypothetical protein